ncbi:hypothetical protein AOZ06_48215 [Kibdelosporangium phytohabitans]|uniref:Uncharacterized protein n=2 Tax=Kibdelosporangium phytohabitans TaxID=860235 RepID=A0A0N9IBC9_9PSEU|nr:hypothetical protein AOZ06_48215 [Kibdelosporangium phytohabitans]
MTARELSKRWPNIRPWLRVNPETETINDEYHQWFFAKSFAQPPRPELAAAYDEWADFYEFQLEQRADELARDEHKRGLVEDWTEEMTYTARRCAAEARGEDPGDWVPQRQRRPDLYAAKEARVANIFATLDAHP